VEKPRATGRCTKCGAEAADSDGGAGAPVQRAGVGSIVQRLTAKEKAENLRSPKLAGNARLQTAFDNSPAMRRGETGEPVRLVQELLDNNGFPLPLSFKKKQKFDGIFGAETERAVIGFQTKFHLSMIDGVVGRQTLRKLDEFSGVFQPNPPLGHQPAGTSIAQQVATADAARRSALNFAILQLTGLEQALKAGLSPAAIHSSFAPTVSAIERWPDRPTRGSGLCQHRQHCQKLAQPESERVVRDRHAARQRRDLHQVAL